MPDKNTKHTIRFVMLGGFLGAGKTTALLRLAREYTARGQRVGIITNDQAGDLVDTLAYREAGFTTEEIPAGCFCCHFEELLEASGRLEGGIEPDVILAEPVGSCTDLVNAVIKPLKKCYADRFRVAPYAVLADPERIMDCLAGAGPEGFSRKVTYLYKMQQNEADIIAVNKIDRLTENELTAVMQLVKRNFPRAAHLPVSARTGAGFDTLIPYIDQEVEAGLHPVQVNYDRYSEGEAALGWLNARVRLWAPSDWDGDRVLEDLARRVHASLVSGEAAVAHCKIRLLDGGTREGAVHSTGNSHPCEVHSRLEAPIREGDLVVNLRAEADPALLRRSVLETLAAVAAQHHLDHDVAACEAFAPSAPVPPPPERFAASV